MKNKILYLLTICICGCMSMFGQTEKAKVIKPTDESTDKNIGFLNKSFPRWQHAGELIGFLPSEDGTGNGSLLFFSINPK